MTPKEQVTRNIRKRLANKRRAELTISDMAAALSASTQEQRLAVLDAYKKRQVSKLGQAMGNILDSHVNSGASTEADAIVADDNLTIDEVQRAFLGG